MKKVIALCLMVCATAGLSGCFSLVDWEHNKNHMRVFNSNLNDMHRSIDRFFFDYDWDDPTRSFSYETPNT